MPRGKTEKPAAGLKIQVNEGVTMPEFAHLSIAGWRGTVLETSGSGSKLKVILEWDDATLAMMPEDYRLHCESQGLVFSMACLPGSDVQVC
ncbi:hypothetical protein [Planctomicrobium sp. SH664]|uniref:hypothetical protein n=1 Tax=Planctomicrobium sp. SH664 TaxID=3448125 RepID=UPI003F5B623B